MKKIYWIDRLAVSLVFAIVCTFVAILTIFWLVNRDEADRKDQTIPGLQDVCTITTVGDDDNREQRILTGSNVCTVLGDFFSQIEGTMGRNTYVNEFEHVLVDLDEGSNYIGDFVYYVTPEHTNLSYVGLLKRYHVNKVEVGDYLMCSNGSDISNNSYREVLEHQPEYVYLSGVSEKIYTENCFSKGWKM